MKTLADLINAVEGRLALSEIRQHTVIKAEYFHHHHEESPDTRGMRYGVYVEALGHCEYLPTLQGAFDAFVTRLNRAEAKPECVDEAELQTCCVEMGAD